MNGDFYGDFLEEKFEKISSFSSYDLMEEFQDK